MACDTDIYHFFIDFGWRPHQTPNLSGEWVIRTENGDDWKVNPALTFSFSHDPMCADVYVSGRRFSSKGSSFLQCMKNLQNGIAATTINNGLKDHVQEEIEKIITGYALFLVHEA